MSKFITNNSSFECQEGELYKLTFPEGNKFDDSYRYFSQDIGSQTEESDILQICELTGALSKLTIDNTNLHRNMNLFRSTLQTEFHRRLTSASEQLYSRMNQRLNQVECSQRDRVEVVRRAFSTQLSDALSHMASLYNDRLRNKLMNNQTFLESEKSNENNKKITDLTMKLKKSEAKIKELSKQILEYEEENADQAMIFDSESGVNEKLEINLEEEITEEMSEHSKQKDKINELTQIIEDYKKRTNEYENTNETLSLDIKNMKNELASTREIAKLLSMEKQTMVEKIEKLQEQCKKTQIEIQELYDANQIKSMTPQFKSAISISVDVQKNMKEFPDMSKEVVSLREKLKNCESKKSEEIKELNKLKAILILENKSNLEEIKILQSINTRLKEEMFNRIEVQKKFTALHSASVAYAKNKQPLGIQPNQNSEYQEARSRKNYVSTMSTFKDKSYLSEDDNILMKKFVELTI